MDENAASRTEGHMSTNCQRLRIIFSVNLPNVLKQRFYLYKENIQNERQGLIASAKTATL